MINKIKKNWKLEDLNIKMSRKFGSNLNMEYLIK